MDLKIIAIYYICDEVASILHIQDDPQCKMSTAEVMTVGIVSALFYGANIELTRRFLKLCGYIPKILSHNRLHRRLLSISRENWETIFNIIKSTLIQMFPSNEFAVELSIVSMSTLQKLEMPIIPRKRVFRILRF